MAYKPQYGPGSTTVAANRRKYMDPSQKLEKVRDISDEDIVLLMGHKAPGAAYPTAHPPLTEQQEPDCPHQETGHTARWRQAWATVSGISSSPTRCSSHLHSHT